LYDITSEIFEETCIIEKRSPDKTTVKNLQNKLKYWTLFITLSTLDDLLSILKSFHSDISLLGRSLYYIFQKLQKNHLYKNHLYNGKFIYFGLCNQLNPLFQKEICSKINRFGF